MARRASSARDDTDEFTFSRRRLSEALGAGLWGTALFLLIALLTFHSSDPSWNHAAPGPIENWGGKAGAFLADVALQFIGLAGFLLAAIICAWGWRLVREHHVRHLWGRFSALLIGLSLTATFLSTLPAPEAWPFPQGLGGSIGAVLRYHLQPLVTLPGLTLLSLVLGAITLWFAIALTFEEWKTLVAITLQAVSIVFAFLRRILKREPALVEDKPARRRRVKEADEDDENEEEERPARRYDKLIESKKETAATPQASLALKQRPNRTRKGEYQFPSLDLLNQPSKSKKQALNEEALTQNAKLLESVLQDFGVNGEVVKVRPGPVVTLYELEPSPGTKSSRVIGLSDDIARSMSATSARIAVIPGRNAIGIELPNATRETVNLRELLEHESFTGTDARLPLALGKDIGGEGIVVDISRMPHLLVAGTTGSGKSVAINTMILSLIYRLSPEECKFIMIDPKMLELSVYEGIPHLLSPVVTEPGKAVVALKWTVKEMENRYRLMSNLGVRNIEGYNKRIREAAANGEELTRTVQTGFDSETGKPIMEDMPLDMNPLPFIVVIVDEMADLMITAGKDVESSIQRLAQMARAAGIHILMATQRPSVDVITGVVKANFPTRISFQVTSKIDSRTVLGEQGAEQLLGQGDMLYMAGGGRITRVHGPFVSDKEVEAVVKHLKTQGQPTYVEEVTLEEENPEDATATGGGEGDDQDLYEQAVAIVRRDRKASTSYIQRHLKIGYNRAARLIDRMEAEGIVGMANHVGKREVLVR